MTDAELPRDPDLDHLPDSIAHAVGPLTITGSDEDGNVWSATVTKDELAVAFADARRVDEADDDVP